jgi:hypothetical protein
MAQDPRCRASPLNTGEPMDYMIAVLDPITGTVNHRPSHTLTLDVPSDLDRTTGVVSLDLQSRAHYIATDGKQREYPAATRPLSWRSPGSECMVADRNQRWVTTSVAGLYRLRTI